MKKVLSVLTAVLLLVSSVSAQQFKTRPGQKTKMDVTIERTQKNRTQPLKAKAFQQKEVKSSVFAKQLKAASKTAHNITIDEFRSTYYPADNDWYVVLYDVNGVYGFAFDIVADTLVWGHTYTLADMLADYTEAVNLTTEEEAFATAATFVYGKDAQGLEYVNATMTDENGDTYTITYQEPAIPEATDTIALTMTQVHLVDAIASEGAFQFSGVTADGNYSAAVAFNATSLVGTFTDNDAFMDATFIEGPAGVLDARRANGTVTANANGGYDLDAYVLCMDAHCYHLTFSYVDPVATDTIDIVATNLKIDDSWASFFGVYFVSASNQDYAVDLQVSSTTGTFTEEDAVITLTDLATEAEIDIFSANITLSNGPQVLGGLLGYDNVYYNLDLSFVMPESTRTETITVPAGELSDLINDMGAFQAMGYNAAEDRYVSFVAYTDQIAGHYTTADMDDYYTFVVDVTNNTEFDFLDGDVTVTYDAATSVATLSGTLLCQSVNDPTDVPLFTINMTCTVSVPGMQYDAEDEDYDEEFSASEVEFDDSYFASYGVVDVMAESSTTGAVVYLEFNLASLDENTIIPAGNYIIDDSEMPGTVIASPGVQNNNVYPSFAGYLSEDGQGITVPLWFMEDGNVTVTASRIEVNATNSYGRNIHVVMNNGVGINDVENAQVSIYPNPATAQLNVVAEGVKMVEIMDATGRCVLASENAGSIDISNLANGIYMVRTLTNEGVNVQKIVKK